MTTRIKVILIMSLSAVLFYLNQDARSPQPFNPRRPPQEIFKRQQLLRFDFKNRELANLAVAYSSGLKSGLTKRIRRSHERLHLQHLFTPSGLHFSALLLFLSPLLLYQKRKRPSWMISTVIVCLLLSPMLLEGLYSIKRISLLKVALFCSYRLPIRPSPFKIFLLVFLFDFLFGSYRDSPLSFSFSFLFLGLIFATLKEPKIAMITALFLGQCLVSFIFATPVYPLGFLMGFFVTSVFSLFFPFIFLGFLFSPMRTMHWLEPILDIFLSFLVTLSQLSFTLENAFYPSLITIISIGAYLLFKNKGFLWVIALNITPATNTHPTHYWPPPHYREIESTQAQQLKVAYKGWSYVNQKQQRCLAKYYEQMGWREFCRGRATP